MNKKVSIIIPVYNAEKTIKKCLDSILKQTYKNLEIILINDGSADNSKEICNEYEKEYKNVFLINKENEGPGKAREIGVAKATGYYISFVDSDDFLDLDFYKVLIKNIEEKEADIVQCGYQLIDVNDKIISKSKLPYQEIIGSYNCAKAYVSQNNITNYLCNKLFVKNLFEKVEFKHFFAGEDACVLTQLYSNAEKVITIPNNLYYYVQTDNSLCRGEYSLKKLDSVKAGEFMYNYQMNKFPDLADYYKLYICSYAAQCYCNLKLSQIEEKEKHMKKMKETFNKYFSMFNPKLFDVSIKRFAFILMFKISPELCIKYYKGRT